MTPVLLLLAGVVVLLVVIFCGFLALEHKGKGSREVHIQITLVPPKLDLRVEHRSD
jgi:uncharacterized protein YxeA